LGLGAIYVAAASPDPDAQHRALFVGLVIAAVWQLAPPKRRALRAYHRAAPLAPSGWAAMRDCLHFGVASGFSSLRSCGIIMAALVLGNATPTTMLAV